MMQINKELLVQNLEMMPSVRRADMGTTSFNSKLQDNSKDDSGALSLSDRNVENEEITDKLKQKLLLPQTNCERPDMSIIDKLELDRAQQNESVNEDSLAHSASQGKLSQALPYEVELSDMSKVGGSDIPIIADQRGERLVQLGRLLDELGRENLQYDQVFDATNDYAGALALDEYGLNSIQGKLQTLQKYEDINMIGNFLHARSAIGQFDNIVPASPGANGMQAFEPAINVIDVVGNSEHRQDAPEIKLPANSYTPFNSVNPPQSRDVASGLYTRTNAGEKPAQGYTQRLAATGKLPVSDDFTKSYLKTYLEPDRLRVYFRDYSGSTDKQVLLKLIEALNVRNNKPVALTYNGMTEVLYAHTTRG